MPAVAKRRIPAPPRRPTINGPVPGNAAKTIGEYIVDQIKAGVDPANAAASAGVTSQEFQAWMREGAVCFARLSSGADWRRDFTPTQQDSTLFAEAVVRARGTHIAFLTIVAEQAARGTLTAKRTTRTRTDLAGNVVERTVIEETVLPDPAMLRWKLERLEPGVYGSRQTINLTVSDLTDTDDVADLMAQRMREIGARLDGEVIDTVGTEVIVVVPEGEAPPL